MELLSDHGQLPLGQSPNVSAKPKRMMEVKQLPSGQWYVAINYSSLELLQTCHRKSHYSLLRMLKTGEEAAPLSFGSAVHKSLEHWYTLPVGERELPDRDREKAELYAFGHSLNEPAAGALESVRQFVLRAWPALSNLDDSDKRSLMNGIKILRAYFKRYHDDQWEVASDASGPMIERDVEFRMYEDRRVVIDYFGTIDVVLKNNQTGIILPADHKTTAQLGNEFYQRCRPNPQYTGYVWAAQKCLGLDTTMFMVNGIQVAKTKQEFARQITVRTVDDFNELRASVVKQVTSWIDALEAAKMFSSTFAFPQTAPNPCTMYGGCQYRIICEVPEMLRENVIRSKWPEVARSQ